MFEWKVEEMRLLNDESTEKVKGRRIYSFERGISREDKIKFVDSMNDGKLSYILALVEKFESEKENLPQDNCGYVKLVSLRAWLKRNDNQNLIDNRDDYGTIRFMGVGGRNIQWIDMMDRWNIFEDYTDEVFNRQLNECEGLEEKYFLEHDEYSILKNKVKDYCYKYRVYFGLSISYSRKNLYLYDKNDSKQCREFTMDELKYLISKYEELDKAIERIEKEIDIKY